MDNKNIVISIFNPRARARPTESSVAAARRAGGCFYLHYTHLQCFYL